MGEATGDFVQNPKTTVSQALATFQNYVTEQLGSSAVTTLEQLAAMTVDRDQ